jgi:hypothetical protein
MNLKFSHKYFKLRNQTSAQLIRVDLVAYHSLHPDFIEYDTTYETGRYPLRHGNLLVLTFIGNNRIPFTTVRSSNPKNQWGQFYIKNVGVIFDIVIEEEKECKPDSSQTSILDSLHTDIHETSKMEGSLSLPFSVGKKPEE